MPISMMKQVITRLFTMLLIASLVESAVADPCVGGVAGGRPCEQVDFLSHVPLQGVSASPSRAADVWGFVDLNSQREFVIVGFGNGTGVFDVTDPANPREVGFVGGQSTVWRDVKVNQTFNAGQGRWNAYAYVTTDGANDGLVVIDMSGLPHSISRRNYVSDFSEAHNVFAATTDYGTGLSLTGDDPTLIVAGSDNGGGGFRSYSLSNPAAPAFLSLPGNAGYIHDAASMTITDARKDTQCVNAIDYCEVLFDFNESTVDIWDITDAASPALLSRTNYPNTGYTHSGWPTEDNRYLLVNDELDEQNFGFTTTIRTFSLADLTLPSLVNTWSGPDRAIDHNGFVRGNRYYLSNYTRGLSVLDVTDATAPTSVGQFDTSDFNDDSAGFGGAWGVYPFLHSGSIAVTDVEEGLFILTDRTLDVPQGTISFADGTYGNTEGQSVSIVTRRSGGTTGTVAVSFEIVPATTDASDLAGIVGTLAWADGDGADKNLNISLANDGVTEGLEQFIVRLTSPTGGATISGTTVANVYVSDPGAASTVEFDVAAIDVNEQNSTTAIAVVKRRGNAAGAIAVDYSLSGGDATAGSDFQGATNGTLNWADGDADPKWFEFAIVSDATSEGNEFFELSLSNPAGATLGNQSLLRINIADSPGGTQPPGGGGLGSSGGGGSFGWLLVVLLSVALLERMLLDNRLFAVRPGRNDSDGNAG